MDWLDVNEAAALLGVDPRQVRNLVVHGQIEGRKAGGMWLVAEASVRERLRIGSISGRPLSAEMAWRVLQSLEAVARPGVAATATAIDRRIRWRLRSNLVHAPPVEQWPAWLRRRGAPRRVWLHPAALERFIADARVAAPEVSERLGVQAGDLVPYYVAASDLHSLVADHHGRIDEGVVRLIAVEDADGVDWRHAVDSAAVVDLVAAADVRVADAAVAWLGTARLEIVEPGPTS